VYTIIRDIETYCNAHSIEHRFVGGVSYTGIVNAATKCTIDIENRVISFKNHNKVEALRKDGTIRDIDLIVFTPSKQKIKELKTYIKTLRAQAPDKQTFPHISVEAAVYPSMGKIQTMFQFVTSILIDKDGEWGTGNIYLIFDNVKQKIPWKSLEKWYIQLENGLRYTVRHPYADYLAYHFRMPSGLKPKDRVKVATIKNLIDETFMYGKQKGLDYRSSAYYASWVSYISNLQTSGGWVKVKAAATRLYWDTIGTDIAHGKGPLSKIFLNFSNKFTGVDQ
jgi:hypothetical protein